MGLMVNSVKLLAGLKSQWLLIAIGSSVYLASISGAYLKGRSDGREVSASQYERARAEAQDLVISRQQQLVEEVQLFLEEERTYNRNLSRLVREEIESSKRIYEELQDEPVIINEDCTLEYSSTLGVFDEAVSLSKDIGSDKASTEAPD